MRYVGIIIGCTLLLSGCIPNLTAFRTNNDPSIEELRMEVADLKHSLNSAKLEIDLLEERVASAEDSKKWSEKNETPAFQKKLGSLEKEIERIRGEIQHITQALEVARASLSDHSGHLSMLDQKLSEIGKLRQTLSQISELTRAKEKIVYKVQPQDSLEKIARKYKVSVSSLQKENNLSTDHIQVGQKLVIPLQEAE
jgi:LysM repeat protein